MTLLRFSHKSGFCQSEALMKFLEDREVGAIILYNVITLYSNVIIYTILTHL